MGCFTVVIECLWGVYRGCYTVFRGGYRVCLEAVIGKEWRRCVTNPTPNYCYYY